MEGRGAFQPPDQLGGSGIEWVIQGSSFFAAHQQNLGYGYI